MKAEIISVGTEILLGDIVNTNSQFLAKELAALGIEVYHQSTVGDNKQRLLECFDESLKRSDLVITTGGLGPTGDDMTKETAAEYFGQELELHKPSLEVLESFFVKTGKKMAENNMKQVYFPKDAIVLKNNNGTAPGAILKKDDKSIIVLPGPPREMKAMFNESVKPYLQQFTKEMLVSKTLRLYGIGESNLELEILDIIDEQTNPTVALYAKELEVTIRITAKAENEELAFELIKPVEEKIKDRVGKYVYTEGDISVSEGESALEDAVSKLLVEKNLTIAVAESCTGGLVSSSLINYPGISSVFLEGCVTYSNESKMKRLGVKKETLEDFGAVSEQTAIEMAEGIAKGFGANIGISTTGVAGPGGGTEEKPVGLVYTAIYINGKTIVKKNIFNGDRRKIRLRATRDLLNELRIQLEKL
ncbi:MULTISPECIES: competence/damage-inducible protein A [unclassified Clostridioides]|uniref:competence/damage-inducible protein A n=1 Tax=unclassified Clostridioides TaxID=2635829 RepID=UPI001D12C2C0|nr:competence/damage-inducible protein A [Clostridioides sp. ZZV14-6150]MCC0666902.1 competence/damage-inducible protein A [Clostridioides sp. ZZV14-6153]MCC0723019.1 competence/damage-inducible protein A [Clostridioides sp. ZZV14-6104]MCC0725795.1 competence/damage-inducible protein A [Clostridioides sp. ZZV14-6045]MCC0729363.1 competence/damage-inducible protein A [Clostridioides sp. ZZV14-6048]MCC0733887.1 competence/damage-inducible protein A [Clostridioides sp. ZZV14-6009]MCC0737783.1 co